MFREANPNEPPPYPVSAWRFINVPFEPRENKVIVECPKCKKENEHWDDSPFKRAGLIKSPAACSCGFNQPIQLSDWPTKLAARG